MESRRRVATPDWLGYLFQFQVGPIHSDHPLNQPLYAGIFRFQFHVGPTHSSDGLARRGNNRKEIFLPPDDHLTFTEIVASQKSKLPFYLYAYCLRTEELLSVGHRLSGLSREGLRHNSKQGEER